jgi:hypothetical protein
MRAWSDETARKLAAAVASARESTIFQMGSKKADFSAAAPLEWDSPHCAVRSFCRIKDV